MQPAVPAVPAKDPPRRRPGANADHQHSNFGTRMANAFRRGGAESRQEREARRRDEASRQAGITRSSSRTDVIDRLDLSGLGASLFHHDSPYDACSPHSNRNARRAPVNAFDYSQDPLAGGSAGRSGGPSGSGSSRPGLSPLAAATMRKMSDNAIEVDKYSKADRSQSTGTGRSRSGPLVPVLGRTASAATSTLSATMESDINEGATPSESSAVDRDVDAERAYEFNRGYMSQPSNVSRGRADVANPMADIWGVTSEPWQDFAAPTSKQTKALRQSQNKGADSSSEDLHSAASSVFDMEAVMTGKQPQQKTARGDEAGKSAVSPLATNGDGNGPKRSKSLIKRIRSARHHPNVPPPADDLPAPSPPAQDRDVQYFANGSDASPKNERSSPISSSTRRGRAHHHSPSMPMNASPQMQSPSGGPFADSNAAVYRSATTRKTSANNSSSYLAAPSGAEGSAPRDRSVSIGANTTTSSTSDGSSSANRVGLQRGNSFFGRLRGNKARGAQATKV